MTIFRFLALFAIGCLARSFIYFRNTNLAGINSDFQAFDRASLPSHQFVKNKFPVTFCFFIQRVILPDADEKTFLIYNLHQYVPYPFFVSP